MRIGRIRFRWSDHFQFHARGAGSDHVDFARGGEREIDDASFDERTAIVDAHVDLFSVVEIGDFDPSMKWKCAMRGGELFHVVNFSGGGAAAVIRIAVPTRDAGFGRSDLCATGREAAVRPATANLFSRDASSRDVAINVTMTRVASRARCAEPA